MVLTDVILPEILRAEWLILGRYSGSLGEKRAQTLFKNFQHSGLVLFLGSLSVIYCMQAVSRVSQSETYTSRSSCNMSQLSV